MAIARLIRGLSGTTQQSTDATPAPRAKEMTDAEMEAQRAMLMGMAQQFGNVRKG